MMKLFSNKEINKQELNEVITLSKRLLKLLYIVFIAFIVFLVILLIQRLGIHKFLINLLKVVSPLFIGFVIAWLLRPMVKIVNTKIKSKTISAVLVFLGFVLILGLILYLFVPAIYEEINELVGVLPSLMERLTDGINNFFGGLSQNGLNLNEFKDKLLFQISNSGAEIAKDLPTTAFNFVVSIFSGIGTVGMGLVIGLYMLIDYESISKHFLELFPVHFQDDIHILATRMGIEARKTVNGTFLVALMVLVCDSIGFSLIGLNAPLLFGFFCGLTDLIPFIGPYIGGAAAVIVGLTQDPLIGVGALIICLVVQLIENYVLQPLVMSKASSMHPIVIIIALIVFGHWFGIIGMVVAVPTLTILRVLFQFTKEKLNERNAV